MLNKSKIKSIKGSKYPKNGTTNHGMYNFYEENQRIPIKIPIEFDKLKQTLNEQENLLHRQTIHKKEFK